jgi:hypothetical protein
VVDFRSFMCQRFLTHERTNVNRRGFGAAIGRVAQLRHGSVARQLVLHRSRKSQLLIELVDGVTLDEVKSKTEANFRVALKNT